MDLDSQGLDQPRPISLGDLNPCCPVGPTPFYLIRAVPAALLTRTQLGPSHAFLVVLIPNDKSGCRAEKPRIATDANRSSA